MKIHEYGSDNGETMIFLHGGGLSWWNYREEAKLLQSDYHVVLPVLDGHSGSGRPFTSIEDNASEIIEYIDEHCHGNVLLMGGLSLGAQVLVEILSRRRNICRYAVVESASVIPSRIANALIGQMFGMSYGLIKRTRFAEMQFKSLHIRESLFEDYYADTAKISKDDMITFMKASTSYEPKPGLRNCLTEVRIVVGEKEQKKMLHSAEKLHDLLPGSRLEVKKGLYHGEFSINYPEQYVEELQV